MTSHHPLSFELLVSYCVGELPQPEETEVEEHLFACAACVAQAEPLMAVVQALRAHLPPALDAQGLEALRSSGRRIRDNPMRVGEEREVHFPVDLDLLIHRLGGLQLDGVSRVDLDVLDGKGALLFHFEDVPVDRNRGEVNLLCQRHFAVLPHDIQVVLSSFSPPQRRELGRYGIRHRFEEA